MFDDIVAEGRKKLDLNTSVVDDDQIFDRFRRGDFNINNVAVNKKMHELAVGIESQFQDDMAATTWSAGLETVLQILPFGKALSALKAGLGAKLAGSSTINALAKGYEIGSIASPIGGAIYAPLHLAMSPARKYMSKAVQNVANDIATSSTITE